MTDVILITTQQLGNGCFFGNPRGKIEEKIWIPNISQRQLSSTVAQCRDATKLSLKLLSLLFTKEEISKGICTTGGDSDRMLLDQDKLEGIRRKYIIYT